MSCRHIIHGELERDESNRRDSRLACFCIGCSSIDLIMGNGSAQFGRRVLERILSRSHCYVHSFVHCSNDSLFDKEVKRVLEDLTDSANLALR